MLCLGLIIIMLPIYGNSIKRCCDPTSIRPSVRPFVCLSVCPSSHAASLHVTTVSWWLQNVNIGKPMLEVELTGQRVVVRLRRTIGAASEAFASCLHYRYAVQRIKTHEHVKFWQNRSIGGEGIKIFQFFKMAAPPSWIFKFVKFNW